MTSRPLTDLATLRPSLDGPFESDIVLYAADTPNTWKVAAVLEELNVQYDVVFMDMMTNMQKDPSYLALNPNGRMPTLVDRSFPEDPFVVFESGAIIQYLCRKYPTEGGGALAGLDDPRAMSEVEQWVMWQVSGLGPMTGQAMYFKRIASPVMEDQDALKFSIQRYEAEALRLMHVLESRLAAQKEMKSSLDRPMSLSLSGGRHSSSGSEACYLVGNRLTLADIACYGYAACHWWTGISEQVKEEMPHVEAWLELLGGRASLQAAFRVPGIAPIPGAPTFAELFVLDTVWQAKLEEHAKAAGRPHFGWRDLSELCKKDGDDAGPTLFQADIESINENKG